MPIDVRCPNPDCDRIHQVKSKYAGQRGKCPACGSWMLIPETPGGGSQGPGSFPPSRGQSRGQAEDGPRPRRKGHVSAEDYADPPRATAKPRRAPAQEDAPPPPHFSGFGAFLLFVAALFLGAVSLVTLPAVEQPRAVVTGALAGTPLGSLRFGPKPDGLVHIWAASGTAAGLALLALLMGLVRRRFGVLSLFPAYLSLIAAAGILTLAGWIFSDHVDLVEKKTAEAAKYVAEGKAGEFRVEWGHSLFLGLGAAAGGFALLGLAMLFMHRGLLGRFFLFLFGSALLAGGAAVVFARELGFDRPPIDLPF